MNRADEKMAFDAMMNEISDSDEEDTKIRYTTTKQPPNKTADSKSTNNYSSDSKQSSSRAPPPALPNQQRSYKMTREEEEIANFGNQTAQDASQMEAENLNVTKRWLARPCSRGERSAMRCYVERERAGFGMQTTYRCFLEGSDGSADRFMMAAKKHAAKKTSYYLVSLDKNPTVDRGSDQVLGKVRGNAVGSRYLITDHGLPPEKTVAPSMLRKEHGVINFEFDSGGPSRIEAWVPHVTPSGVVSTWQPDSEAGSMETRVEAGSFDNLFHLVNKAPKWDEAHGGHVLNFQGRVTESSVKNFQLCCAELDDPEEVLLQFGRVGKHKFTMDIRYPLSPLQAFSICVSCLDNKIADRKGYEYLKKLTTGTTSGSSSDLRELEREDNYNRRGGGGNRDSNDTPQHQARGSMTGTTSISGMIPSSQYLRDKITRTFK